MNRYVIGATLAAVGLSVAACGSSGGSSTGSGGAGGSSASGKPIQILAIQAVSGILANSAKANVAGFKAAIADVNSHGGVDGRMLKLTVKDDRGDPTQAVSLLQNALTSGHKPDLLIDGTTSSESLALSPIVNQNKLLTIGTNAGLVNPGPDGKEDVSKYPTRFSTSTTIAGMADAMVKYLQGRALTKVAIIAANDAYGELWSKGYAAALKTAGITVTGSKSYDPTTLDMTPQLQALRSTAPQALLAEGYGAPSGYILQSRQKLGWTGTPMIAGPTFATVDLTKLAGASTFTGVKIEALAVEQQASASRPAIATLVKDLTTQGPISLPILGYAFAWDAIQLPVAGMRKAKSTDATKVAAAMQTIGSYSGTVIQPEYFSTTSHAPADDPAAYAFVSPGPFKNGFLAG